MMLNYQLKNGIAVRVNEFILKLDEQSIPTRRLINLYLNRLSSREILRSGDDLTDYSENNEEKIPWM